MASIWTFCLFFGVWGMLMLEPHPSRDELEVFKGTVVEYHYEAAVTKYGGAKYIYVSTETDFLKFGVYSGQNDIIEGKPVVVRAKGSVAWELEQNGRVIYTLEKAVAINERMDKFNRPMIFLSVAVGIVLTPFWFINRRKNRGKKRTKVRTLF